MWVVSYTKKHGTLATRTLMDPLQRQGRMSRPSSGSSPSKHMRHWLPSCGESAIARETDVQTGGFEGDESQYSSGVKTRQTYMPEMESLGQWTRTIAGRSRSRVHIIAPWHAPRVMHQKTPPSTLPCACHKSRGTKFGGTQLQTPLGTPVAT